MVSEWGGGLGNGERGGGEWEGMGGEGGVDGRRGGGEGGQLVSLAVHSSYISRPNLFQVFMYQPPLDTNPTRPPPAFPTRALF